MLDSNAARNSAESISTVIVPPSDTVPPPERPVPAVTVTLELTSSSLATPPFLIVTSPSVTAKLSALKDAIPLFDVVASSPEIVIVDPVTEVLIPSPAAIVRSESTRETEPVPVSAARLRTVEIVAVDAAVIRPCWSIVITGTAVAEP